MWNPFKSIWKEIKPYSEFKSEYLALLSLIKKLLKKDDSLQYEYIEELILCIRNQDYLEFKKRINTVDMWGGAGAVWETILKDEKDNERFEKSIIELINLLEKSQWLNRRMKYIRKYLKTGTSSNTVKWIKDEIKEVDI